MLHINISSLFSLKSNENVLMNVIGASRVKQLLPTLDAIQSFDDNSSLIYHFLNICTGKHNCQTGSRGTTVLWQVVKLHLPM